MWRVIFLFSSAQMLRRRKAGSVSFERVSISSIFMIIFMVLGEGNTCLIWAGSHSNMDIAKKKKDSAASLCLTVLLWTRQQVVTKYNVTWWTHINSSYHVLNLHLPIKAQSVLPLTLQIQIIFIIIPTSRPPLGFGTGVQGTTVKRWEFVLVGKHWDLYGEERLGQSNRPSQARFLYSPVKSAGSRRTWPLVQTVPTSFLKLFIFPERERLWPMIGSVQKIRNGIHDITENPRWENSGVKLWQLRVSFLFLSVGPGIFKLNKKSKQRTNGVLSIAIMKNKWGTVTVIESTITQRERTLINTIKRWNRRDTLLVISHHPVSWNQGARHCLFVCFSFVFEVGESLGGLKFELLKEAALPLWSWWNGDCAAAMFIPFWSHHSGCCLRSERNSTRAQKQKSDFIEANPDWSSSTFRVWIAVDMKAWIRRSSQWTVAAGWDAVRC